MFKETHKTTMQTAKHTGRESLKVDSRAQSGIEKNELDEGSLSRASSRAKLDLMQQPMQQTSPVKLEGHEVTD